MRKILNSILMLTVLFALFIMQACNVEDLPVSPNVNNEESGFILKDSISNMLIGGDTVYVNQVLLLLGNDIPANVATWNVLWGDATNSQGNTNQVMAIHKYTSAYTNGVVVLLQTWDNNNNYQEYRRTIYVLSYQANLKPIFKVISATSNGGGSWTYTLGFLRMAVECTPNNAPFFVDTISNWVPSSMSVSDTTADGYYKKVMTFLDNQQDAFTYGGSFPTCYASIAPRPPQWSSAYYVDRGPNDRKLQARFNGGQAYTIGTTFTTLPGLVGDSLNPVMRLGFGVTQDTIKIYFCKLRAQGNNQPNWSNTVNGINNQLTLSETPGHPDWWTARFLRANLPLQAMGCVYRTGSILANMAGSYFWDPIDNWLEFQVSMIGDSIVVKIGNKQFMISPAGQVKQIQ